MDLQQLIEQQKKGRSYATLAKDTGGALTRGRLQQIATTPQKEWLKPDNIRALATALHVSEVTVVLAVAESLGLDTRSSAVRLQDYLPAQTGRLTEQQMAAIGALIRSIVTEEEGEGHDRPAATTQPPPNEGGGNVRTLHPGEGPPTSAELPADLAADFQPGVTGYERVVAEQDQAGEEDQDGQG